MMTAWTAGCVPADPGDSGGLVLGDRPAAFEARCIARDDNVLRYDCTVEMIPAGRVDLLVTASDGESTLWAGGDIALERHHFTVRGLRPLTHYAWQVRPRDAPGVSADGSFDTEALPPTVDLRAIIDGEPTWEAALLPFQCGGPGQMVVVDGTGAVRWYQEVSVGLSDGFNALKVDGFDLTERNTVSVVVGHHAVREYSWAGDLILDANRFAHHFERPVHHDVLHHGGIHWVLNASTHLGENGTYVMDGVYALDDDGRVLREWDLADHVRPDGGGLPGGYWGSEFPGAIDYSHGNGIALDAHDDMYLSFRKFDTVIKVRGGVDSPGFGVVEWALSPDGVGPFPNDFTVVSSNGVTQDLEFADQHHPSFDSQGRLLLFDNGAIGSEESRALAIRLDEQARVADIEEAWNLRTRCTVQGSLFELPDQRYLATCATARRLIELAPGAPDPVSTMVLQCANNAEYPLMVRAYPLSLSRLTSPAP